MALRMLELNEELDWPLYDDPDMQKVLRESNSLLYLRSRQNPSYPLFLPTPSQRLVFLKRAQQGYTQENLFFFEEANATENYAHAAFWIFTDLATRAPGRRTQLEILPAYPFVIGRPRWAVPDRNGVLQPRVRTVEELYQVGKCVFEIWPFIKVRRAVHPAFLFIHAFFH